MKIVNIIGGLGNQMFQFAFFLALKKRHPKEDIKIYTGTFKGYSKHNAYELDKIFGLNAPQASFLETTKMAYPYLNYKLWQIGNHLLPQRKSMFKEHIFGRFYEEALNKQDRCYYDGYWQNEKYFSDMRLDILMAYSPIDIDEHNIIIGRKLFSTNSVSIHVRHGDYMQKSIYQGICGIDYYQQAISYILRITNAKLFCVFSNDIPWCKEHIIPLLKGTDYIMVDWNTGEKNYLDMYLMSNCRHNIIAHSSFSWWGAWLNQHTDKVIIGPRKWNNIKSSEFQLPHTWIKI